MPAPSQASLTTSIVVLGGSTSKKMRQYSGAGIEIAILRPSVRLASETMRGPVESPNFSTTPKLQSVTQPLSIAPTISWQDSIISS